jgi:2-dehydropantoate 2-reductase
MNFVIFGAGAVGGVIAARLAGAGNEVSLIARGAHLEALRERGLKVRSKVFGDLTCRLPATDEPAEVGPADVVLLTV